MPRDHRRSIVSRAGAGLLLALSASACTDDAPTLDARSALDPEAAAVVVPGSTAWGEGELCPDGGDCSGPITVETVDRLQWVQLDRVTDVGDGDGFVEVVVVGVDGTRHDTRMWAGSLDDLDAVDDLEVWVGLDEENGLVGAVVAFDDAGRFAGVGHAAFEYVTAPMAEAVVASGEPTARAFFVPLFTS